MKIKKSIAVVITVIFIIGISCISVFASDGEVFTGSSTEMLTNPPIIESGTTTNSTALRIEQTKLYNSYGKLENTALYLVEGQYFIVDYGEKGYIYNGDHSMYGPYHRPAEDCKVYKYSNNTWEEVTYPSGTYNDWHPYTNKNLVMAYNDLNRGTGSSAVNIKGNYKKLVGFGSITINDFKPVMSGIKSLLPVIVPTIVGFLALRKGWRFVRGETATA